MMIMMMTMMVLMIVCCLQNTTPSQGTVFRLVWFQHKRAWSIQVLIRAWRLATGLSFYHWPAGWENFTTLLFSFATSIYKWIVERFLTLFVNSWNIQIHGFMCCRSVQMSFCKGLTKRILLHTCMIPTLQKPRELFRLYILYNISHWQPKQTSQDMHGIPLAFQLFLGCHTPTAALQSEA